MIVGDVEDQNISLLACFERAALGGKAEGVGGVDGGKCDGFGELKPAITDGEERGGLHAAGGAGGHGEAGTDGDGGIAIDQGTGNTGGGGGDDGDGGGIGQEANLRGGKGMLQIENGGSVGEREADPVRIVRLPAPDTEAGAERAEEAERVAIVGEKVEAERGGEVAASGALELSGVELGFEIEGAYDGRGDGIGRGEGAESEVGADDAGAGGAVGEGKLENAAGEGGVGGDGKRRVDEGRHDDGAVHFDNDGVAGFAEVIDTPRLADTGNAAVADEYRTVGDDAQVETGRAAARSLGAAQGEQLAGAAEEQRSMHGGWRMPTRCCITKRKWIEMFRGYSAARQIWRTSSMADWRAWALTASTSRNWMPVRIQAAMSGCTKR